MGSLIHIGDGGDRLFLTFDNILNEDFDYSQQLTRHTVQTSAKVADHIIEEPFRLNVVGRITETPFANANTLIRSDYETLDIDDPRLDLIIGAASRVGNRPRSIVALQAILNGRRDLWEYISESMGYRRSLALVNVRFRIDRARHVDFDVTLEEIEFASATRVELPPLAVIKKTPPQCPVVPKGDGVLTDTGGPDGTQDPRLQSTLYQFGATGGALKAVIDAAQGQ